MGVALIFASLIAILVVTAYLYVKNAYSYWKRKEVPYSTPSFPCGNFLKAVFQRKSLAEQLEDIYNESTDRFVGVYTFLKPALLIRDPNIIKDILITNFHSFSYRGWHANVDIDPMGNNILLQRDEKWKRARTQFSPAFTPGKLKGMFNRIVDSGKSLDKYIDRFANTDKSVEMRELFGRYTTNVIASVALGIEIDSIDHPDDEFRKHGLSFFEPCFRKTLRFSLAIAAPALAKLLKIRWVDKKSGDFMIDAVRQNKEIREKSDITRKDFFQLLMQLRNSDDDDKKTISVEEMAAHTFLFFGSGSVLSGNTMSFCLYELSKHPEIQQKVYDEIVNVLKKHNGELTDDAVTEMKYIGQCLDECLRLHPTFPVTSRSCTKEYKIPDSDVVIEEGTMVFLTPSGLQHDPKYYDEPRQFKPERYDASETADKGFDEMPNLVFGLGPRDCLGMRLALLQSKVALILLLRKFKFDLDERHRNTELKMNPSSVILAPINGIHLKVLRR